MRITHLFELRIFILTGRKADFKDLPCPMGLRKITKKVIGITAFFSNDCFKIIFKHTSHKTITIGLAPLIRMVGIAFTELFFQ